MAGNPYGILRRGGKEWGRKARKAEDHERGLGHRGDRQAIAEQLADASDDKEV